MKLKFYSDPRSGWLVVKEKVLKELNILNMISKESFIRNKSVYLHEDRDYTIFAKAASCSGLEFEINHIPLSRSAAIRSYDKFKADKNFEKNGKELLELVVDFQEKPFRDRTNVSTRTNNKKVAKPKTVTTRPVATVPRKSDSNRVAEVRAAKVYLTF